MTLNLQNFAPALKTLYTEGAIANTVFKNRPFMAMLKKMEGFYGENKKLPMIYGNPNGRSANFANAVSNKTNSKLAAFFITRVANYSMFSVDNQVIKASQNNEGAVLEALKTEIDGALNVLSRDISLSLYRDGSGCIALISATQTAGSTTLNLSKADDIVALEVGQAIQPVASVTGGTPGTVQYVVSIDRDLATFQVSATQGGAAATATASGFTAGVYIVGQGDYGTKIAGLQAWLPATVASSGDSFFGVNRFADRQRLAGYYKDLTALPIEEALIGGVTGITRFGGKPTHCFLNPTDFNRFQIAIGTKAIWVDINMGKEATYGFQALQVQLGNALVKVFSDQDCPSGEAFMLQFDTWELWSLGKVVELFDGDGLQTLRDGSSDSQSGQCFSYANLTCKAPAFSGRIRIA
jgi:hypothetical protein